MSFVEQFRLIFPCLDSRVYSTSPWVSTFRTGAMNTESPVRMKTAMPVTLCSLQRDTHRHKELWSHHYLPSEGALQYCMCCSTVALSSKVPQAQPVWMGQLSTNLTPRNLGASPGAEVSVSIFRESMWAMEMTVAATYHGSPMKEQITMRIATQNRSRW